MKKDVVIGNIYSVFGGLVIIFIFIAFCVIIDIEVSDWKTNENCTLIDIQITQTISNLTDIVIDYDRYLNVLSNRTRVSNTESWSIIETYSLDECNTTVINRYNEYSEILDQGANITCYRLNGENGCSLILETYSKNYGGIILAIILVIITLSVMSFVEYLLITRLISSYKNSTDEENSTENSTENFSDTDLAEPISSSDN